MDLAIAPAQRVKELRPTQTANASLSSPALGEDLTMEQTVLLPAVQMLIAQAPAAAPVMKGTLLTLQVIMLIITPTPHAS